MNLASRTLSRARVVAALALPLLALRPAHADPPRCTPPPADVRTRVVHAIELAYRPSYPGCAVAVAFGPCVVVAPPARVRWEDGAGHGGGITLTELRRDGASYRVTRVHFGGWMVSSRSAHPWQGQIPTPVTVARGTVAAAALLPAVREALTALDTRVTEREPPRQPGQGRGGWSSSGDRFHRIQILSATGATAREYAGYDGDGTQRRYLPLRAAMAALEVVVAGAHVRPGPVDPAARAVFSAALLANAPHFADPFHWWVAETYLNAAAGAGDTSVLPTLVARLHAPAAGDVSGARGRVNAINALAALTGRDLRYDANGAARPVDDVAREYLRALRHAPRP